MKELGEKNYAIISAGSVDGICTSAALLRILSQSGVSGVAVLFTQAFTVNKLDLSSIKPNSSVILVDLAVNNKDEDMTFVFINNLINAGHKISSIIDEHDSSAWSRILNRACIDMHTLSIKPVLGKNTELNSSGALLLHSRYGKGDDSHIVELCEAADAADRMDFSPRLAKMVIGAIKSRITEDARRKYLVHHLAEGETTPDDIIAGWISEYDAVLLTHEKLKKEAVCITKGLVRIDASGEIIDMTVLLSDLYEDGARVAVVMSDIFNFSRGYKFPQCTIATCDVSLDVLSLVKTKVPSASGFASKANMDPEFESIAIDALLEGMTSL